MVVARLDPTFHLLALWRGGGRLFTLLRRAEEQADMTSLVRALKTTRALPLPLSILNPNPNARIFSSPTSWVQIRDLLTTSGKEMSRIP